MVINLARSTPSGEEVHHSQSCRDFSLEVVLVRHDLDHGASDEYLRGSLDRKSLLFTYLTTGGWGGWGTH